ncbi:MAG: hypothetical protein QOI41_1050 [Myxococcales bacterium]|nr:hypothetical protein [Myxococcales bacterium]
MRGLAAQLRALPLAVLVTVAGAAVIGRVRRPAHPNARTDNPNAPTPSAAASMPPIASGLAAPLRAPASAGDAGRDSGDDAGSTTTAPRMVHGSPRHLPRSNAHGPRTAKMGWRAKVDGGVAAQVTTSPDERTLYVATLAGSLVALARDDGKQRWSTSLGERVYSTPLVADDGTIYAGSDAKKLTALSAEGAVLWRLEVDGEADSGPVLAKDGTIVFAAGSSVYSVRRGGDVAWRFTAKGKIFTAPALGDDGLVIVGSQDDRVYAIGPGGALAWSVDLGADVDGSAVIGDDGTITVGTDKDELVRLDGHGTIAWRTKVGGYVRGVLSLARNGDVLAGTYGPVPRLVRVAPDGTIRGAFAIKGTGAREFGIHGGPLEDAEGTLFFGAQDDAAYAIDTEGAVRWRFETGADVDAPLSMLSDGSLVVASEDGTITMLLP